MLPSVTGIMLSMKCVQVTVSGATKMAVPRSVMFAMLCS